MKVCTVQRESSYVLCPVFNHGEHGSKEEEFSAFSFTFLTITCFEDAVLCRYRYFPLSSAFYIFHDALYRYNMLFGVALNKRCGSGSSLIVFGWIRIRLPMRGEESKNDP
jgi:hypothetical protein